uniref:Uncharacterized protein n=1 Tax=Anguilla anguilla TaxID=7936 RepID=A0A0E9UQS4_ANGAN
MVTLTNPDN